MAGAPRIVPALGLWSQPGVFSWDRADPGSARLLEAVPALYGEGADLGCGIGLLARSVLASPKVTALACADLDGRAVACAEHNLDDARVKVVWADLRKPLDGVGNLFCCAWRPDQIGDPNTGRTRGAFFDQTAYALPAPGKLGNAKKGSLKGPGTWVVNFAVYKDLIARGPFRLQFSALLDNAFNHPQFFPDYGSDFVDLTSYLIDGDARNGSTGVLGAGTIANAEGFSPGRVIRLGIRTTF